MSTDGRSDQAKADLLATMPPGRIRLWARDVITLAQPIEAVFDCVADDRQQEQGNPVCIEMRKTSRGPVGQGSTFTGCFKKVGRMHVEIVAYDRPRMVVHRAHPGMAEVGHIWTLTEADGTTRLEQAGVMQPTGWDGSRVRRCR